MILASRIPKPTSIAFQALLSAVTGPIFRSSLSAATLRRNRLQSFPTTFRPLSCHSHCRLVVTTCASSVSSSSSTSSPATQRETTSSLKHQITELSERKAARKLYNLLAEAEEAEDPLNRPDSSAYRSAIRSQLRLKRPDLALDLYRLRRKAQQARPDIVSCDVPLISSLLRMTLRDDLKRKDRSTAFEMLLEDLRHDCAYIANNREENRERLSQVMAVLLSAVKSLLESGEANAIPQLIEMARGVAEGGKNAAVEIGLYNTAIRMLGKNKMLESVFEVLDMVRLAQVKPDNETFEFLANAAVRQVRFVKGAVSMDTLPEPLGAEVAFVGRSNVGKSSLVNMICNRKALAYVSGRPGKTQQFNYFLVNERSPETQFYLVDLPGVGYAKVPIPVKEEWLRFMRQYLKHRTSLRIVFHLIDGRHGALADDEQLMQEIAGYGKGLQYVLVLTKMDKADKQRAKRSVMDKTRAALVRNGCSPDIPIVLTSASSRLGRDDMWRHMQGALRSLGSK
ncbi:putative GTP-binding protein EngB [Gracilariopsis chorda]|uniref:Putative GTP-binding protein EngB n=1 Tax=Gracilariopsis chorda TaxID=448386 RepID=A0A2V3IQZ2_9FLOR|nr:putative GTP-binding protein EngB [Gracilariopsis chorda]|eukprot:PXF44519.1 putative GTP-binding protein EngB [Gracilariopsis chorda]